jgi:hypothetical protein
MYQITYTLPDSKQTKSRLLKMDEKQLELYQIINKNFQGVATLKTGDSCFLYFASLSHAKRFKQQNIHYQEQKHRNIRDTHRTFKRKKPL